MPVVLGTDFVVMAAETTKMADGTLRLDVARWLTTGVRYPRCRGNQRWPGACIQVCGSWASGCSPTTCTTLIPAFPIIQSPFYNTGFWVLIFGTHILKATWMKYYNADIDVLLPLPTLATDVCVYELYSGVPKNSYEFYGIHTNFTEFIRILLNTYDPLLETYEFYRRRSPN